MATWTRDRNKLIGSAVCCENSRSRCRCLDTSMGSRRGIRYDDLGARNPWPDSLAYLGRKFCLHCLEYSFAGQRDFDPTCGDLYLLVWIAAPLSHDLCGFCALSELRVQRLFLAPYRHSVQSSEA